MGDTVDNAKHRVAPVWVRQGLVLALPVLAMFPFVAWYLYEQSGGMGLLAAAVAGAICLAAGILALAVTDVSRDLGNPLAGLLGSILIRTMLPLFAGVAIHTSAGPLAAAGTFGAILVFYLVTLAAETMIVASSLGRERSKAA